VGRCREEGFRLPGLCADGIFITGERREMAEEIDLPPLSEAVAAEQVRVG